MVGFQGLGRKGQPKQIIDFVIYIRELVVNTPLYMIQYMTIQF